MWYLMLSEKNLIENTKNKSYAKISAIKKSLLS